MRPHADPRFDLSEQAYGHPFDPEAGVAAEVKAGAVVFFNGYVLHRSLPNHAAGRFRRALVTHYMNARSLLPWSLGQPPVPRADYRDIEMVAGEDPYAWKGLCSISHAFVRRTEDA